MMRARIAMMLVKKLYFCQPVNLIEISLKIKFSELIAKKVYIYIIFSNFYNIIFKNEKKNKK